MNPVLLPDGRIRIVRAVEGPDGRVGHAFEDVAPGHPTYDELKKRARSGLPRRRPGSPL